MVDLPGGVFPWRRLRSAEAEEVVVVGGNAVLDVERPTAEASALGDEGAVGDGAFGDSISAVMVFDLFLMLMKTFSVMPVMPSARVSEVRPAIRSGRPTSAALTRSMSGRRWAGRSSSRFGEEERLQFLEFLRVLRGEVVDEAEVLGGVEEFPGGVVIERAAGLCLPRGPCG
jgi:hypothetical protein